jgi:hypothetical protein
MNSGYTIGLSGPASYMLMYHNRVGTMATRKTRVLQRTASLASELMLAPTVVWMRMPLLAAEARAQIGLPGSETVKAVTEKGLAVAQGVAAAQMSMFRSAMRFWPELLAGKTPAMLNGIAAEQAFHAALKPAGKKVRANYRRLSTKQ